MLVRDRQSDTLFFINDLSGRLWSFSSEKSKAVLHDVVVDKPLVNFIFRKDATESNYQFFIDYFTPENPDPNAPDFTLYFKNLSLKDGSFRYLVEGYDPPEDRDFDENNFAFNHINADMKDFTIVGDSLNIKIKNLSTTEKNGLRVNRMVCRAAIHRHGMSYEDLVLKTDRSLLTDRLIFEYDRYSQLSDFIDSVYMRTDLSGTRLDMRDIAYFSHTLDPYAHNIIAVKMGSAKGTVKRFKVRDLSASLGNNTSLTGNFDFTGLPNWESCFSNIALSELRTTPEDVQFILNMNELPPKLDKFEDAVFSGHLTGFFQDFAADGVLSSSLGLLNSRINFKLDNEVPRYTGTLQATDFALGAFLDQSSLGNTSFYFELKEGSGLNFEDLSSSFDSRIEYIEYNGYPVQNILASGTYRKESFEGDIDIDDAEAKLSFSGKMNFHPAINTYQFTSDIQHINLKKIGFDSIASDISALMTINLKGTNLDNLDGLALISDLKVKRGDYDVNLNRMELWSGFDSLGRHVELRSDIVDASVHGNFNFSYLDKVYFDILHTLFPEYYEAPRKLPKDVAVSTKFTVRRNEDFGRLMQQNLILGNGEFSGTYNSNQKSLEIDGVLDEVVWEDYRLSQYYLNVRKKPFQLLNMSTDVKELFRRDTLLTHNILLNASIMPNDVDFLLNFADTTDDVALRSYGAMHFSHDTIGLRMMSSHFYVDGIPWNIDDNNQLWYSDGKTTIDSFSAVRNGQSIRVSGIHSGHKNDRLFLDFRNFDLANFNKALASYKTTIGGVANGSVELFNIAVSPAFKTEEFKIRNLAYDGDTLGNFTVSSRSDKNPMDMKINARVEEGLLKNVSFIGDIDLTKETPNLDISILAKDADIKPLENIFTGIASDFTGTINADARFKGTPKYHTLKGTITAKNVGVTVDYLNTRYFIDDKIYLNDAVISFKSTRIKDINGNSAYLNGMIKHKLLSDFYLDLHFDQVKNFMCLNTTAKDNNPYYGTGIASGSASFVGPLDNLKIDINATSEKGTRIVLPLYEEGNNQLVEYISFKQPVDTSKKEVKKKREEVDGLTVNMNFNVTEDAEFVLLFDEVLDDKITGSGKGKISMEYTSYEDFYMYGDFTISKGIYPFSSPMMVSEKFDLKEGGKIVWNGDPYNAYIDLQAAVARNRANPWDLMVGYVSESDKANYNTNIKMNVILYLQGELFSPEITFGMEFPDNIAMSNMSQFNSMIKRIENDPDELNRQIFSLLTFGSFTPTATYSLDPVASGNDYRDVVSSSIGSFLSNQVNNWISEYSGKLDVGIDYQTRSGYTDQDKAALIVSVRRKMFQDRLEFGIAGSVNSSTTGATNPYNVDLIYNVKKDGSLRLKAYHKVANDPTLSQISNVSTSGVGFYFKKQFNHIRLWGKKDDEETDEKKSGS